MDTICVGITAKGERCTHRRVNIGDGSRCRVHHRFVETNGPNTAEIKELKYKHKKELNDILVVRPGGPRITVEEERRLRAVISARHAREIAELRHRHAEEVRRTGVDPDAPAHALRRQRDEEQFRHRRAIRNELDRIRNALRQDNDDPVPDPAPLERNVQDLNWMGVVEQFRHVQPPAPLERDLRGFVNDAQNVHTTESVRQTREIVERIQKIAVPDDYKWDGKRLKTVGEIMCECSLTPSAAAQMFNQYVSRVSVYDIEEGIYGKVLDCVWQYIKSHKDKDCLVGILRQEMEDNIGMCAQGNLSRICNIVAGFMEGVGSQESLVEKLGRLFPPLMEIEDDDERIRRGKAILKDNNVPAEQWTHWLAAL